LILRAKIDLASDASDILRLLNKIIINRENPLIFKILKISDASDATHTHHKPTARGECGANRLAVGEVIKCHAGMRIIMARCRILYRGRFWGLRNLFQSLLRWFPCTTESRENRLKAGERIRTRSRLLSRMTRRLCRCGMMR
jgi:hypothetical protein